MPPLFQSEVIPSRHPSQKPQLPLTSPPRTPKKIKKYTILISVFLLLLLFASQNISNFQKLALNCLDRSLSIPIKLKQAKFCSHLSGSSPIHRFIQDFDFAISSTQPLLQSLFSSGLFYQDSLSTFRFSLGRLSESASDLDGQLKLLQPPNSLNKKIFSLRQLTAQLLDISSDLPRLLAVNSQTSFLVLIQDSTELRSSGGLVDTLAHLTLSNTHLISSRFFSSSSLSATSSSPPLWQKLTRQSVWQIRDANFDPNFPVAATEISRLFTRSTSLPVDYVVALNLQTLKNLLDFTGPVSFSEVDTPLTSQNLISSYLEYVSRTGSQNLFLSSLVSALFSQTSRLPAPSQINILYYLLSQLQSRQIFITPVSVPWDGSLSPPSCPFPNCFSDFLIPVENHIGLNKSSAYLLRSASLSHSFSPDQINTVYELLLNNTHPSSIWPAGGVKNYFQLFLPPSSSIDSVNMEHSISQRSGFNVISLIIDIPPGQTRRLLIRYRQPFSEVSSRYRFTYLPQPGLFNFSFTHTLNYPDNWSVTTYQVPAVAQPGRLQYNNRTPNPYILDLDIDQ